MKSLITSALGIAVSLANVQAAELQTSILTEYQKPAEREAKDGEWLPARRSAGAIVYKGKLYVAGGHVAEDAHGFFSDTFMTELQVFDLAEKKWTDLSPRNLPGRFSSLVGNNDYLYSFGGFYGENRSSETWESYDKIERYDIRADRWEVLEGLMPHRRSQHCVVQIDSHAYLIGGWDSAKLSADTPTAHKDSFVLEIDVFDLAAENFVKNTNFEMPETGRRGFSCFEWNQKIVIAGGFGDGRGSFLDSVLVFDPKAESEDEVWSRLPSLPKKMIFPMIVAMDDDLYLVGGTVPREGHLETAYVLRKSAESWVAYEGFTPGPLAERVVVPASENSWLLLGGRRADDSLSPEIQLIEQ